MEMSTGPASDLPNTYNGNAEEGDKSPICFGRGGSGVGHAAPYPHKT